MEGDLKNLNTNPAKKTNVFFNRNFRLVFLGALVSELGALLYSFAVGIRANNPDTLESYKQTQQYDKQIDHFRYILYTNDAEYGNIMVCGTEKALSDAGVTGGN